MTSNKKTGKILTSMLLAVLVLITVGVFPVFAEEADTELADTQETVGGTEGAVFQKDPGNDFSAQNPNSTADDSAGEVASDTGVDGGDSEPENPRALGAGADVAASSSASLDTLGEVSVELDNAGELQVEITALCLAEGIDPGDITKLTVTGDVNDDDLEYIWKGNFSGSGSGALELLEGLDLSGAAYTDGSSLPVYQFAHHPAMQTVALPSGLTSIGHSVFLGCESITSVDLSNSTGLTSIGESTFQGCIGLADIDLSDCTSLRTVGAYTFYSCERLESVIFPDGLTSIGVYAFGYTGLKYIDLPAGLELFDESAFMSCEQLEVIDLSGCVKLTTIGESTFQGCTELHTVVLSGCTGLTSIGRATFFGCTNLTILDLAGCTGLVTVGDDTFHNTGLLSVDLSDCAILRSIGDRTFQDCTDLETVRLPDTGVVVGTGADTFDGCRGVDAVVPMTQTDAYAADTGWGSCVAAGEVVLVGGYGVTIKQATGGTVWAYDGMNRANETVVLYVIEDSDYTLTGWRTTPGNLTLSISSRGSYFFTMPAENVTITPVFAYSDAVKPSGTRSSGAGGTAAIPKTQIPASAFAWDGERTLTIDYDGLSPLALLSVEWDDEAVTAYSAHEGSVILCFDEDFISGQAAGEHTVRVEFWNHCGATKVTLYAGDGAAGTGSNAGGVNDNPQTGGVSPSLRLWLPPLVSAAALAILAARLLLQYLRCAER